MSSESVHGTVFTHSLHFNLGVTFRGMMVEQGAEVERQIRGEQGCRWASRCISRRVSPRVSEAVSKLLLLTAVGVLAVSGGSLGCTGSYTEYVPGGAPAETSGAGTQGGDGSMAFGPGGNRAPGTGELGEVIGGGRRFCGTADSPSPLRRLSQLEYAATLEDLFSGLVLPALSRQQDARTNGFTNNIDALTPSELLVDQVQGKRPCHRRGRRKPLVGNGSDRDRL